VIPSPFSVPSGSTWLWPYSYTFHYAVRENTLAYLADWVATKRKSFPTLTRGLEINDVSKKVEANFRQT
jgi:hypothetical protein